MKVFVIAGEVSGDKLGAALMSGLKERCAQDITFQGVGGAMMRAEGLNSQFPMDELSVMGIVEVLPKYFALKRRISECADAILSAKPDVVVTIDSPDFCLRVAKQVKAKSNIRWVHYVAPSVWAWRPKRAEKMARFVDQVLALLPFEPPYMEAVGLRCDFVGHPVVTEPQPTEKEVAQFREKHGLAGHKTVLLLPGSRKGEVSRLWPVLADVMGRLKQERDDLKFLLPMAGPVVDLVKDRASELPEPPILIDPTGLPPAEANARKRQAFAAADAALAASGTVSLELAAAKTPMVIAYDVNWLSRIILKRMLRIDTLTLINLVAETRVVPEFIAENCRAELIAPAVSAVLKHADQQDAMETTMQRLGLGQEAPGLRAAQAVLDGLRAS